MDSRLDIYNKLKKMRFEYKKNPSPELEAYIEKLVEALKNTLPSGQKVFSRLNLITSYFTLKDVDSQRSKGKFNTYEEAKKFAEENHIDLSDEDSPYFIDEVKEVKIEPKKFENKKTLSDKDKEELQKLRDEKSYWKSIQVKDSDHRREALKNIGRINRTIKQKFGLSW